MNIRLPDGSGTGTAFAHQYIDAVERDVPEDLRSGFFEYGASEIQQATFEPIYGICTEILK